LRRQRAANAAFASGVGGGGEGGVPGCGSASLAPPGIAQERVGCDVDDEEQRRLFAEQENAIRKSCPHCPHRARAKPWARMLDGR
jgi:hypothetical protein